jgi:glycosyltransferase involved in cell wall biosynthesis
MTEAARRRRRVLQISQDLGIGGLERVVASLCRTMDRSRFEPLALCLRERGAFAEELAAEGVPVFLHRRPSRGADYFSFLQTARLIRRERIDIVHTHNTDALLSGALGAILSGRRVRVVHTDHARPFPDAWRYMVLERLLSLRVHRMVGVSTHTTENLRRYEKIPERKLVTILNGVVAEPFDRPFDAAAKRQALGIPAEAIVFGLGARLTHQKGIDVLIEAMALVRRSVPDALLLIAGEGPEEPVLRALAEHLGVADAVRFLGPRLDLHELMRVFDVYVLASRWEGLPMALLEAMAARCAIASTAVGGIPDAVRHEQDALLMPPEDPAALARALLQLAESSTRRASLAASARAVFDLRYSADVMTRQYEALYVD